MRAAAVLLHASVALAALQVDLDSPASIKKAAKLVASDLMTYYHGNESGHTPGILPGPPPAGDYYWWQAGAMWGTLVDYWHYTGDKTYNDLTESSLVFQAGAPQNCYMPPNWTASLGNDDQGFWGMSAMLAAETNFQNPPADQPQWLALAQAVFNTQAAPDRHDDTCGGGLRWQIPPTNNGYNYKNTIANGILFNMGARLARYTGNSSYADWSIKTWNWLEGVGFIDAKYNIYDGADIGTNCTNIQKPQFTYNAAVMMQGAAFMYNFTNGSSLWETRLEGLVNRSIEAFFSSPSGAAVEIACEQKTKISCTTDMLSFKGYLHRWMASTAQVAPFTHGTIMPVLRKSTAAAVKACSGGPNGRACGFRWTTGAYDGLTGAGQQMNVLAALSSLLLDEPSIVAPLTNGTGGTSRGDPGAGGDPFVDTSFAPITTGDRAGASILTVVVAGTLIAMVAWMSTSVSEASVAGAGGLKKGGMFGGKW